MTIPKKQRRSISVDGERYHWVAQFERSGHVVIQHATGRGPRLIIELQDVMLPRHVAAAIRFARECGWTPLQSEDIWLGFILSGDEAHFERIPAHTRLF